MERTKLRQPSKRYTNNISYTSRMLDLLEKRKREIPLIAFRGYLLIRKALLRSLGAVDDDDRIK